MIKSNKSNKSPLEIAHIKEEQNNDLNLSTDDEEKKCEPKNIIFCGLCLVVIGLLSFVYANMHNYPKSEIIICLDYEQMTDSKVCEPITNECDKAVEIMLKDGTCEKCPEYTRV